MNKKGFTLVELMAVLIILALIAIITIPSITKIISKQQKSAFVSNVKSLIEVAKADYYNSDYSPYHVEGYEYSNNKLNAYMIGESGSTSKNVKMDGKIIGGEGVIDYYYDYENDEDIFAAAIHDSDYCVIYYSNENNVTISDYEGTCDYDHTRF